MDRADRAAAGGGAEPAGHGAEQGGERERRLADRGDRAAGREREADERETYERQLRKHAAELRASGASLREQAEQAVEQAKAVLEASQDRVRRAGAGLRQAHVSAAPEQASVAGRAEPGNRHPFPRQREFAGLADRVSALRRRTAVAAARLASAEEEAARIFDEPAAREPGHPEHKRLASEARETMRRAREAERKYGS